MAYTDLAAGDCFAAVDISDTTQAAQGSLKKITATSVFAAAREITIASGTVTVSTPVLQATQTWNAGGVTFTAIDLNVTATASAAASLLINLRVAGSSMFKVDKTGAGTFAAGVAATTGTFTGTVSSTSSARVLLDGSDTATSGAVFLLANTAATRFWGTQLSASNHYKWFYFDGAVWNDRATMSNAGALTLSAGLIATTGAFSGLLSANAGATVASGQTLTVTGATITGLTAASVGAGTYPAGAHVFAGALSGITTLACAAITSSGQLLVTNTSSNQAQIRYDGSNYLNVTVSSAGKVLLTATGSGSGAADAFTIQSNLTIGGGVTTTFDATTGAIATGGTISTSNSSGITASAGPISTTYTGGAQFTNRYDTNNRLTITTSSGGVTTFATTGTGTPEIALSAGATEIRTQNNKIGFYNTSPQSKGTVTGSRGANAALASLLTLLASYGLLTDSSS